MLGRRLVIVSGKGGVGKSALAAATALAADREGRRVLVMAMAGSGSSLAAHLGVSSLQFAPTEIRPGLSALVIDRARALVEYLQVQMRLPGIAAIGPVFRAFDALATTAPAIREIVAMGKVLWEVRTGDWDLVVADAPATGQIGSYLRAARTITELVPSGRIREQADWMQDILSDPDHTALVLATIPEELPTAETRQTLDWLDEQKVVGHVEVAANRVLPPLELASDDLPGGRAGDAARLHHSLWVEQSRWLEELPPDVSFPFLFGVMTPAEVAAQLADSVEGVWGGEGR